MLGERYWRKPSVESGRERAPRANSTSGTAVTAPPRARSAEVPGWAAPKAPLPRASRNDEPSRRERRQEPRLPEQADDRVGADGLAREAVEAERDREREGDPGQAAVPQREDGDPGRGERHREPLRPGEALAQHQDAEQHVDERVDEIAEARLDHVVVGDRPDVEQPVERDEDGAPASRAIVPGLEATARASGQRRRSVTHAATATKPQAVRCATTSRAGTAASSFQ